MAEPEIKDKAISVSSVLATMAELEEFNGLTEPKVYENWYELKRQLGEALLTKTPKEANKDA